jgi:Type II CAAX prenyl endopeptidase Rce1-like
MWNTPLFLLLVATSLIALLIGVPRQVRAIARLRGNPTGGLQISVTVGVVQNLTFAIIAIILGILFGRQARLDAPVFEAVASGVSPWMTLRAQIIPATLVGTGAAGFLIALYYGIFRPQVDRETIALTERLRLEMGLLTRVLIGGVFEEIVYRWGLMGLFAWIGAMLVGTSTPVVMWASNFIAAFLFGVAHLPGAAALGIRPSRALVSMSFMINITAGMVFGWLLWIYGLFSAMLAHAMFHFIFLPFERYFIDR